jgi:hypothetical protein
VINSTSSKSPSRLGTIDYLAPEILECPPKAHPMDFKDDPKVGYSYKVMREIKIH